jgi:beta-glucanase (GH16 family)
LLGGCGGDSGTTATPSPPPPVTAASPAIATTAALGGATIVSLASATAGATIHYTTDGSTPTAASPTYAAPFLVTATQTIKAVAEAPGLSESTVASQTLTLSIAPGTLVWSDEFANAGSAPIAPNANVWIYDTGNSGFGNAELETYCASGSNATPCLASSPNAYVGSDGLHIVARNPAPGVYTSARLKTQGLFSFRHGRVEVTARIPEAAGLWPAIWLLGNSIDSKGWPACGEIDMMEHVNATGTPDTIYGSIHAPGANLSTGSAFAGGQNATTMHVYGMIWTEGQIALYVDNPANIYATYTIGQVNAMTGGSWPFDNGQSAFLILNLAVGGSWPGPPDATTPWPSEMVVRSVRIYTN